MKVAKVITGIIIVLLVALFVGFIVKFTNGFNEDFKTFYLERDGKQILTSETETSFTRGKSYRYGVKYTFDDGKSEPKGYSVKVVPNGKIKLSFKADGKQYSYADAKELTEAFTIRKEASAFTISIPENQSLKGVLEKVYGKEIEVEEPRGNLYSLIVSSYNGKVIYTISFSVVTAAKEIELNAGNIIFGAGRTVDKPAKPSQSETAKYGIEYDTLGSGSVQSVKFECVSEAKAGETVTFIASLVDLSDVHDDYYPLKITRIAVNDADTGDEEIELGSGEGTFSFKMPAHSVTVMIYLMPAETPTYSVKFVVPEERNGSNDFFYAFDFQYDYVSGVEAGETVTFTLSKDKFYAMGYKVALIGNVYLKGSAYGGEGQRIGSGEGSYSFAMPKCDVTVYVSGSFVRPNGGVL